MIYFVHKVSSGFSAAVSMMDATLQFAGRIRQGYRRIYFFASISLACGLWLPDSKGKGRLHGKYFVSGDSVL